VVWYAGWTDKIAQVFGGANPVAGPYFNFSLPVPSGVVGVVAEQDSSLEAFVDAVCAPIAAGNAVVVLASERRPTPAVLLGEMTATSDFPAGVLNILTGRTGELAPTLAAHEDVDGVDLAGVDEAFADELALLAAGSIKRVLRPAPRDASLARLRAFTETSTVWHTIGQ
jgi:acyl-CoA reductase-like NAD-dependent aldehyde dehydrogenase